MFSLSQKVECVTGVLVMQGVIGDLCSQFQVGVNSDTKESGIFTNRDRCIITVKLWFRSLLIAHDHNLIF